MKIEEELKMTAFQDETHKAVINILFTAGWIHNRISANLKKFGLYHEQFNVLRILRGQHPAMICQKDILCRMINKSSNLTRIISKLKEKHLVTVEISDRDKREYTIGITGEGLELLKAIDKDFSIRQKNFINLSVSEAFHLNALLDRLRNTE
jgi:DNA-binding MarR family transcriptional regulator